MQIIGIEFPMIQMLWLMIPIVTAVTIWYFSKATRQGYKGPKSYPIVGSYFQVVKNIPRLHDWILGYFTNDCRTIALDMGTMFNILTVDPINVEYILKTNFPNYLKGDVRTHELLGDGIFNVDGEMWKRHRKVASYEFVSRKVNEFSAEVFKEYAIKMMDIIDNFVNTNSSFDFQDICTRMTMDSICKVTFGMDVNALSPSLEPVPLATTLDRLTNLLIRRSIGPVWKLLRFLNLGPEKQVKEYTRTLDLFIFKVVENRRKEMEDGEALEKQDLLSRFMTSNYDDKELRDAIISFLLAGRDTTAVSLSWFMYCVCTNPNVADKIREELVHTFGNGSYTFSEFAELLTTENLRKLHYLHATISETLRLYPPVPQDGKRAASDDVLPDGTKVKKGDFVTYVPYSMGRMEFLWGPDALEFKPERWIKDSQYQSVSPFVYTTFQAGPRICLGKDAAYLQIKITAAMLVWFFKFELVENQDIRYKLGTLAMVNGIMVRASRM